MYFKDRTDAGKQLAEKLTQYKGQDVIVYGLPRGGVVTAYEIAKKLKAPLDLIITRKIGHPYQPEYAIAALSENGKIVENKRELAHVDHEWFEEEVKAQHNEIQRRRTLYLKDLKPLPVKGKIAILIDDGIATGFTIEAAIRDVKYRHPKKIIVAVPVAPLGISQKLEHEVDKFVALDIPQYFLGGIGAYYGDFPQVSDEEVTYLMSKAEPGTRRYLAEHEENPAMLYDPLLFSFPDYAYVSEYLLTDLPNFHEEVFSLERFPNKELFSRIQTSVSNMHCFLIGSIAPPDDNLLSFLLVCHTLKKEGAKTITAVLPYLAYSRHDKRELGKSLGTAWVGKLLETSGITHVITIDVHSKNIYNLFPIPVTSLSPAMVFAEVIKKLSLSDATIVAPDEGARTRCEDVARCAGIKSIAYFNKKRLAEGITHLGFEGEVTKQAIIIDDILDTGKTLLSCATYLQSKGVKEIYIFVTHGIFTGSEWKELFSLGVKKIYCSDTIPEIHNLLRHEKIAQLSILPLLSRELKRHLEDVLNIRKEVEVPHIYV